MIYLIINRPIEKAAKLSFIHLLVLLSYVQVSFGQLAPGNIGNSDGSYGQPELKVWLVSDSLSLIDGNDVLNWNDNSGNNNNFSAVSATSPIFRDGLINGHDYIEFSKSNNRIVSYPFDIPSSAVTIFMVLRTTDSGDGIISYATSSNDNEYLFYQSDNLNTYINQSNANHAISYNDGNWKIFSHQWRSSDGQLYVHVNGNELANTYHQTGVTLGSGGAFAIGGEQDGLNSGYTAGQDFDGDIAEFVMYGSSLNQAQRTIIENYLAQKYGLDANLPVDYYSPATATYIEELSGMGKESDGEAELNSGGLVVSGTNNYDNGEYIFAAHDGTVNSINTSPNVLYSDIESAWERNWYLEKTGSFDARIAFDLSDGIDGNYPSNVENYKLLYKANTGDSYDTISVSQKGTQNGDQIYFDVADADILDGYFTLGTINETDSPLDGVEGRTWYTLINGDWDNWEVWTLDPSGMLPDNPGNYTPTTSPTGNADKVVIRSGKTITVTSNNKSNAYLRVDGRLDFTTTSNHSFGEIEGGGRILVEGDNFPDGDATHFSSAGLGEGTIVYYGGSYNLTNSKEFYNVEVNLANSSNKITLLADYTINGNLRVENGILQINDNSSATVLNILVGEDINVLSNGQITTGQGDAYHQLTLKGDLINEGRVEFTNRSAADYINAANDGVVELIVNNGSRDQEIQCLGVTNFYRIEINKGLDKTYILNITASQSSYFNLFGYANQGHNSVAQLGTNTNALGLLRGTVKIGPNVNIPVLNNSGNYNISESARLWVNGGYVAKNSGTAIVPYGDLQITSGSAEALVYSGVTMRENGAIIVEGGTLTTNQVRTSVLGSNHVGGYSQSGGEVHITGANTNTDYYCFNLTYNGNVFNMSGGTLHIHEAHGRGGIFIASDESNYSVTGGTVILEIDDNNDFAITSAAPFWDVIIRNSSGGNGEHRLVEGVDVGTTDVYLATQPLVTLNDLTIESDATLETEGEDVFIGRNFTIEDDALYEFHQNTTYFNGTSNGILYIGDITGVSNPSYVDPEGSNPYASWEHPFYGFTIDKPASATLTLATGCTYDAGNTSATKSGGCKNINNWKSNLIKVAGPFALESGQFDIAEFSVRLYDDITNKGIFGLDAEPINALIKMRKETTPSTRVITTEDGTQFGNLRLNSGDGIMEITSNVYVKRLEYKHGRLNIGKYNLKVDTLVMSLNGSEVVGNNFSVEDMIIMDGNASDGGLSIYVPQVNNPGLADPAAGNPSFNPTVYFFPIGTGTTGTYPGSRYTPANIRLSSTSDDGYVTVNVVSKQLTTAGPYPLGNDVLNKYFRIRHDGFTTVPKIDRMRLYVTEADIPDGTNDTEMVDDGSQTWNPAYVLDNIPYSRISEINDGATASSGFVDNAADDISIFFWGNEGSGNPSGGCDLVEANYTAGDPSKFFGQASIFYTRDHGASTGGAAREPAWQDRETWTRYDLLVDLDGNSQIDDYELHDSRQPAIPAGDPDGEWPDNGDIAVIGWVPWTDVQKPGLAGQPHGVWVSDYTQQCAEIRFTQMTDALGNPVPRYYRSNFQFRPTICINWTNGNIQAGLVKGEGMFWNRNSAPDFSLMDIGEFAAEDSSYIVYESWANPNTIGNTPAEFPNLLLATDGWGNNNKDLTFTEDIKTNGNLELLGDINLVLSSGATGDIEVGNNLEMFEFQGDEGGASGGFGEIAFPNNADRTITINNDLITTGRGSVIQTRTADAADTDNNLIVFGNIEQDTDDPATEGLQLYSGATTDNITLTLRGEENASIDITSGDIPQLYRLVIDKGTDQSTTVNINDNFTLNGPTSGAGISKALELLNGSLILDNSNINIDLNTGDDDFIIPSTSSLEVRQGQVNVSGNNTGILLDGKLSITGGTVDMVSGPGNGNNYIEYSASGNAELEITSGLLNVGSQIRRGLTSDIGMLTYSQTGGTVNVGVLAAPKSNRGVFEVVGGGSSFTHTNGDLSIVRQQSSPTIASLYLEPGNYSIAPGTSIDLGNASTPAGQDIGITSTIPLRNLNIDNSSNNDPTATIWISHLTVLEDLTVDANASFDANGFDLTLQGDFNNYGTYIPNSNTTYFKGSADQNIQGNTNFYNLIKSSSTTLMLEDNNAELHVYNDLDLQGGIIDDNNNSIFVDGYCNLDALHLHRNNGDGIVLQGSYQQQLTGNGTFGKLTINNANNILVPLGNEFTITDTLKMKKGIFYIGSNLLTLNVNAVIDEANPFSESNMIQTNISFTDNGVRKIFPAGSSSFTFPIGASGKYTPIFVNASDNGNSTGHLTVKAANEIHPSIIEDSELPDAEIVDSDNVLQYHWLVNSSGIDDLSATVDMKYIPTDVSVTSPYDEYDYITARLLNDGSGNWNKYDDTATFDEVNQLLHFTFTNAGDDEIGGDYTAGVDGSGFLGAIPDQVPFYESASNGDWETGTVWAPNIPGGPRGSMVRINIGDAITLAGNYSSSYTTEINGVVNVNTTFGHRFGIVSGNGLIYLESEALPAGIYDDFFASTGGTVEFGGTNDYDVLAGITKLNNLSFSGDGEKRLPNQALLIRGDLEIDGSAGLNVVNEHNQSITVNGDLTLNNGIFDAGYGSSAKILLQGSSVQNINGDFTSSNNFNILEINNSNGVNLNGNIDVAQQLTLTNGVISTNGNALRIKNNATISPSAGSSSSYIDGAITKELISGSNFIFPIADGTNRGTIEITNAVSFSGVQDFEVQYYFDNPTDAGYDSEQYASPLNLVSESEYWDITGPVGVQVNLSFTLDGSSDVANSTDLSSLRVVAWNGSQWVVVGGVPTVSGTASSGTVTTSSSITLDGNLQHFTLGSIQLVPQATATIVSNDETICDGSSTDIEILLTGEQPWIITYEEDGAPQTITGITTNNYLLTVSPVSNTTYVLTSVTDNNGSGTLTGNLDVTITVESVYAEASSNDANCYGVSNGNIAIYNQSGGSGNYQYSINGGTDWYSTNDFISLSANTYDVRIRDANPPNCEYIINNSLVINEPTEITASLASSDEQCQGNNDGEITIVGASGGSGNFEYSVTDGAIWLTSNTFSNLAPNTYEVWVRDQNENTCEVYLGSVTINPGIVIDTLDIYRIPNE